MNKFKYKRIDLSETPHIWVTVWNLLMIKGQKCKIVHHNHISEVNLDLNHILYYLSEHGIYNVLELMTSIIHYPNKDDFDKPEYIHKLLLSML